MKPGVPKLQLPIKRPRLKIVSSKSSIKESDHSKSRELSQNKSDDDASGMDKSKLETIHLKLKPRLMSENPRDDFEVLDLANKEKTDPIVKVESLKPDGSPGSIHQAVYKKPISFSASLSPGKFAVNDASKSKAEVKAIILNSYKLKEKEGSSSLSGSEKHAVHSGPKRTISISKSLYRKKV